MRIILANRTNFDQPWAESGLYDVLTASSRVLILPFEADEGWAADEAAYNDRFFSSGVYRDDLLRPFRHYGIAEKQIQILAPDLLTKAKLENSDVLVLAGADPLAVQNVLTDFALTDRLKAYRGVLLGMLGGAEVLMDTYRRLDRDDQTVYPGLGLVHGMTVFADYRQEPKTLKALINELEQSERAVLVMPQNSAVLVDEQNVNLLGEAFFATMSDLDALYSLYASMMC